MYFIGWSPPPHPIDVIPSVEPHSSLKEKARAVLRDYYHDSDLRTWSDRGEVKSAFSVKRKEDYDTESLVAAYENPKLAVWSKLKWSELSDAVQKAIAKRTKLGPLEASSYDTDPVVIYYYDNDWKKKIVYPRASISSEKGKALDPSNMAWWKNWGIGTFQQDPASGQWGNEGFDWDKDVAGNIGQITGAIMAAVGVVLQIIPGVGTAVGTAILLAAPVVGSLLGAADTAFHGGDMPGALGNIAQSLLELGSKGLSKAAGIKIGDDALKSLGASLGQLAGDAAGLGLGKKFEDVWPVLAAQADKYARIGPSEIDAIQKALGSDGAAMVFRKGYDVSQYASPSTITAISALFSDPGAAKIFEFGAGLGLLSRAQKAPGVLSSLKGPSQFVLTLGKKYGIPLTTQVSGMYWVGEDDFGSTMAKAFGSAASSLLTTAASEGSKAISKEIEKGVGGKDPKTELAMLIAQLGAKYGVPSSLSISASFQVTGELVTGELVGQDLTERFLQGKTASSAHMTNYANPALVGFQSHTWFDPRYSA